MSDERPWARVTLESDENFGKEGWVGRVDHNDVQVFFEDGTSKYYHAMSLKKIER